MSALLSMVGLLTYNTIPELSKLIQLGHQPTFCFSHKTDSSSSSQSSSFKGIPEEKSYLELRLRAWHATKTGESKDSIFTQNQLRIRDQLESLSRGTYSMRLNALRILRMEIFSCLRQARTAQNLKGKFASREVFESSINRWMEQVVHLFYEVEEYISTGVDTDYPQMLEAARIVSNSLADAKKQFIDQDVNAHFDKAYQLWLLFEECLKDRKHLFPLLLAPRWPTPLYDPLSIRGLELLRECAEMLIMRLHATQYRMQGCIQVFKESAKQLELPHDRSKECLTYLKEIENNILETEKFITHEISLNPALLQIIKILKEKRLDLVTISQLKELFTQLAGHLEILKHMEANREKLIKNKTQSILDIMTEAKKNPSASSKVQREADSIIKKMRSCFRLDLFSTIGPLRESLNLLNFLWYDFIQVPIEYLDKAYSECEQIQHYRVLKLDTSLLKSQYVTAYELFLINAYELVDQFLDSLSHDKEINEEESEALWQVCLGLKFALSSLQNNSKYLQGIDSRPHLFKIWNFLNTTEKKFLEFKHFSPASLSKMKPLENLATLLILPFRFYPSAEKVNPFMLRVLSQPLGSEFNLTPALSTYFDYVLVHTKKVLEFREPAMNHFYEFLLVVIDQAIPQISIQYRASILLRINKLLGVIKNFFELSQALRKIDSFQQTPSQEEVLLNYIKLLSNYQAQVHDCYSWDTSAEDLIVKMKVSSTEETTQAENQSESNRAIDLQSTSRKKHTITFDEFEEDFYSNCEDLEMELLALNYPILKWVQTYSLLQKEQKAAPLSVTMDQIVVLAEILPEPSIPEEEILHEQQDPSQRSYSLTEVKTVFQFLLQLFHRLQVEPDQHLRKETMRSCLDNIESYYLTDLNELLENAQLAIEMPYTYAENLYLKAALIIEQSAKFLLAYFDHKKRASPSILLDWIDSKKQLRSSHDLTQLLDALEKLLRELNLPGFTLSDQEKEAIGFFQNIIQASSRYLEKSRSPEASLLKQLSQLSYFRNACSKQLLNQEEKNYLTAKFGSSESLWKEGMEKEIHLLLDAAKEQATASLNLMVRILQSIFPKEKKEIPLLESARGSHLIPTQLPAFPQMRPLLAQLIPLHEELLFIYRISLPNDLIEFQMTEYEPKKQIFRDIQFSHALSEIPHYFVAFEELISSNSTMIYSTAHCLLIKACLLVERCQMLLLSHFDIPSEKNPELHILFEEVTTESQTRMRAHSHDLKQAFTILEKALKDKNKNWQFKNEVVESIFSLHNYIGVIDRYPSMQTGTVALTLNKLRELSLLQVNLKEGFFTEDQLLFLNKKGAKETWSAHIQKDIENIYEKEIYPLIESCVQASMQMLKIAISSI